MFENRKLRKKINILEKKGLILPGDKILIAFSGGPDSVFLFEVLTFLKRKYPIEIGIIYINHNLRKDVDKDIDFVSKFSEDNGISAYIKNANVIEYSKENRKSVELAARELRYNIIGETSLSEGYNKIATGHNLDDNVETLIFRLLRGTSLKGMKGIPEQRGNIIRPLLQFEKKEILEYLAEKERKYVIDYTNSENNFTRNYIRNEIFPKFHHINPGFRRKINELILEINERNMEKSSLLKENPVVQDNEKKVSKEFLVEYLEREEVVLSRGKIDQIYSSLYEDKGILKGKGSKEFFLGGGKVLRKEYDRLEIIKLEEDIYADKKGSIADSEILIRNNSRNLWKDYEIYLLNGDIKPKDILSEDFNKQRSICLSIRGLPHNIEIYARSRREGDYMALENLGHKKIKKILIDKKISKWKREEIPIIVGKYLKDNKETEKILTLGDIKLSKYVKRIDKKNIFKGEIEGKILIIGRKNER